MLLRQLAKPGWGLRLGQRALQLRQRHLVRGLREMWHWPGEQPQEAALAQQRPPPLELHAELCRRQVCQLEMVARRVAVASEPKLYMVMHGSAWGCKAVMR